MYTLVEPPQLLRWEVILKRKGEESSKCSAGLFRGFSALLVDPMRKERRCGQREHFERFERGKYVTYFLATGGEPTQSERRTREDVVGGSMPM